MSSPPSMFELFASELKNQSNYLASALPSLLDSQKESEKMDVLLRVTHSIKGTASAVGYTLIGKIAKELETCFLEVRKGTLILKSSDVEVFFEALELFQRVSITEESKVNTLLHQPSVSELYNKIRSILLIQPLPVPEKESERVEAQKEENLLKKPESFKLECDLTLFNLFQFELAAQVSVLTESFLALEAQLADAKALEQALYAIQAIKDASRVVKIFPLADLAYTLENYLLAFKKGALTIESAHFKTLRASVDCFSRFRQMDAGHLSLCLENELSTIEALIESIQAPSFQEKNAFTVENELLSLFQSELETQLATITTAFLIFEREPKNKNLLEKIMRALHTIKGAARTVNMMLIGDLAHTMEDCIVATQEDKFCFESKHFDLFFEAVDLLSKLRDTSSSDINQWLNLERTTLQSLIASFRAIASGKPFKLAEIKGGEKKSSIPLETEASLPLSPLPTLFEEAKTVGKDRVLRVTAQNLNRLMGLVGESLVESRWLQPFSDSLNQLKSYLFEVSDTLDGLVESLETCKIDLRSQEYLKELVPITNQCRASLRDRLVDLEMFTRRHISLSDRLYQEVIDCRMRPFADGISGFPRLVRDTARQLGKKVKFEVSGLTTPVDREILEKLEAPLNHLILNSLDHGIEFPSERLKAGKPEEGLIQLSARHLAGLLVVTLKDNGQGIDLKKLYDKIIEKKLATKEHLDKLSDLELLDFLFLPGFSTATTVTRLSGRGVGLNVLQTMLKEVGGSIRIMNEVNVGISFVLELPTTLSVIRALIADISGETYAFPLARIDHAIMVPKESVYTVENRLFFTIEGKNIGIIPASQVLNLKETKSIGQLFPVIVISDRVNSYGLLVNAFIGEKELVVQELDPRLGKVPNISAGAFMEDGSPILIVDVEALVKFTDNLLAKNYFKKATYAEEQIKEKRTKRILVVEDSITVREVESRLLKNQGYEVESAVDGMDGWNAVRANDFDLVVTDIDMPNLNGFEMVRLIKSDPSLKNIPVMIVSYKESEEDRRYGVEVGANYYLSKNSFQDEALISIVSDLIGPP